MQEALLPNLVITDESLITILKNRVHKETLIVTDIYNYQLMETIGQTVLVNDCLSKTVEEIKSKYKYSEVYAVGGCTALDVGRACAGEFKMVSVPTILSTTCISADRSKIEFPDGAKLIKTKPPVETIVSIKTLLDTDEKALIRWTQSGFGDLFANISASIDYQYLIGNSDINLIKNNVPEAFEALNWVLNEFNSYSNECLIILAKHLHNSSIDVIVKDSIALSSAGEHILYHKMVEKGVFKQGISPTHGQIVGIGALINSKVYSKYTGEEEIFVNLKNCYKKLRLPTTFEELAEIGIDIAFLKSTLIEIPDEQSILGKYFKENGFDLLNEVFSD